MKKLTPVQKRELKSLKETGSFNKCTPRTFNSLYVNGLIESDGDSSKLVLTEKAVNLL